MIAIYYNPHKKNYYAKVLKSAFWSDKYKVGYINQYDHQIVCMFYINGGKLIACKSMNDYVSNRSSIKKRIFTILINLLDRVKVSLERSVKNGR